MLKQPIIIIQDSKSTTHTKRPYILLMILVDNRDIRNVNEQNRY